MKRIIIGMAGVVMCMAFAVPVPADDITVPADSKACVVCHTKQSPSLVGQWEDSKHAKNEVGCYDCHAAEEGEVDAFKHNGKVIATIVSPKDCAQCHEKEEQENTASHHSKAANFIGSLDNILGEIVEGKMAVVNGCQQCHGSTVDFQKDEDGNIVTKKGIPQFDPLTWPNTGIGRVNPDGSWGSCTACHSRHSFSSPQARFPDTCGKCHMGPDHPQIEIYNESKHGIAFRAMKDKMNMDSDTWVVGEDYDVAPTCSTCHMSATKDMPITHDVGARISWTLRPVISTKLENWEAKRSDMKKVCTNCHASQFINSFYVQFDGAVDLYNEKFAIPAQSVMTALKKKGKITATPFDDEIEWTFFFLWHHEGRRARMGASMQGPDYTQWHGFFEVAHRFYWEFMPQARELAHGDSELEKMLDDIMNSEHHKWKQGLTPKQIKETQEFYMKRYKQ